MIKPIEIKEKSILNFQNLLSLVIVVSAFIYLFIGDRRELVTGVIALVTVTLFVNILMATIACKDDEIRQLHYEAKQLALATSGTFIDNAAMKETKVDVIHTENISGNITTDKLMVEESKMKQDDTK